MKEESHAVYSVSATKSSDDAVIAKALLILSGRIQKVEFTANAPESVKNFLSLKYAQEEREIFSVLWLNTQNGVIAHEELSIGTINQASVYPREVVKAALKRNAAGCIFSHNHPSGLAAPSQADITLTAGLKTALALVDVRVLDHLVVGGIDVVSFAERGLI